MGIWSTIAGAVGDYVSPGAGSVIKDIGNVADVVAPVIANVGAQNTANKQLKYAQTVAAGNAQVGHDQLALDAQKELAQEQASAAATAIAEEKAKEAQQADAYSKAMHSALAKHIQDASIDVSGLKGVPSLHFTGGSRPSALGPEGQAAASVLNNQAMNSLINPPSLPAVPTPTLYKQTNPTVPAPPDQSFWDQAAGALGLGTTLAGNAIKTQANAPPNPNAPLAPGESSDAGILRGPADVLFGGPPTTPPPVTPPTPNLNFGPGVLSGITFAPGLVPPSTQPPLTFGVG
jgi:hypothetical protein